MSAQAARTQPRKSASLVPGCRLHRVFWCQPRWWLGVSLFVLVAISLIGPASLTHGPAWLNGEGGGQTPFESIGSAGPLHDLLALTGPRGISLAASLQEGRPRTTLVLAPTATDLAHRDPAGGDGLSIVAPRAALLTVRGLLDVRAPPIIRA